MKVLLINPPVDSIIKTELPEFVRSETGIFPPLGLMYIAAYLKKYNPGHEIYILDTIAENMDYQKIGRFILDFSPDIVGITAHTHNLADICSLISIIKEINPEIRIVLGGPHVNIFPQETIRMDGVDYVIKGEAEMTFSELLQCLSNNGDLNKVEGIIFKRDDQIICTPSYRMANNLDAYPFPDRRALNSDRYRYALSKSSGKVTTMITSRGCPFHCAFCSTPKGSYRIRSAENIVDEIEDCLRLNIHEIHFVDDSFGCNRDHLWSLCHEIKRRNLDVRWGIRARADTLKKDQIFQLKDSGCVRINIGVETSSDEGMKMLQKGVTIDQVKNVFRWTKEANMITSAYFMIGCPHEKTKHDVERVIDFAIELDPDYAMFNILTLYSGTELYQKAVQEGIVKKDCWHQFVSSPSRDFQMPFWEEGLSRDELLALLRKAYRRFYLRPKVIRRSIKNAGGFKKIIRNSRLGIKILMDKK
ncbi:MAG: cobalamin-dependent protein [Candidatus Omnitrophica bacterium]|nr:cobalamin-dependent protein [Candidatus Omnitrophota bacterium]